MTTIPVSQFFADSENCADPLAVLLDAIQQHVRKVRFSRRRFDEAEIVNEVFVRMTNTELCPFGDERFYDTISQCTRHTLRDYKLAVKPALDIDDLSPDKHPFYIMDSEWEEAEFEKLFRQFCESRKEPKRKVYLLSRFHNIVEIAKIVVLTQRTVSKMLKEMHGEFQLFLKNSSSRAH